MNIRELRSEELETIWTIDRSEVIEKRYIIQEGILVLKSSYADLPGWPPGMPAKYTPILRDCFARGGTFYGAFEGKTLIAVAILDSKFIGRGKDRLQLKFLFISRAYRKQGLGRVLFDKVVAKAKAMQAQKLYISATPSENAINFYLNLGCVVTPEPDQALLELEPADIHLEYTIP